MGFVNTFPNVISMYSPIITESELILVFNEMPCCYNPFEIAVNSNASEVSMRSLLHRQWVVVRNAAFPGRFLKLHMHPLALITGGPN